MRPKKSAKTKLMLSDPEAALFAQKTLVQPVIRMVTGIKNSISLVDTFKTPKADKPNVIECPIVKRVTSQPTLRFCLKLKTMANTIRNKI